MKRFFRPITILISLAVMLAFFSLMQYLVRPATIDQCIASIRAFHQREENVVEVLALGSSHTWKGLNPMVMYEEYGIGAYNYGCNWQVLNTTYLFLQDALKTQSPKVVLIETYHINEVQTDLDMNAEIYYTRVLPWSQAKVAYLTQCFSRSSVTGGEAITTDTSRKTWYRWAEYLVPLLAFHNDWTDITLASFCESSVDASDFVNLMGYCRLDDVMPVEIPIQSIVAQLPLEDEAVEILDAIVALCEENDIQIVFYTMPYQGNNHYHDAITAYAKANGCDYLDLYEVIHLMELDQATDYADKSHLNDAGTTKLSRYLAEYLVANYDLTDMRQVEGNMWATALDNLSK